MGPVIGQCPNAVGGRAGLRGVTVDTKQVVSSMRRRPWKWSRICQKHSAGRPAPPSGPGRLDHLGAGSPSRRRDFHAGTPTAQTLE